MFSRFDQPPVWIAWERQRRSTTLAAELRADLKIFEFEPNGIRRYLVLSWKTIPVLWRWRKKVVFVQNPSMVLSTLASLLRPILGYVLVVDRHSNFIFDHSKPYTFLERCFLVLNAFTLRYSDVTIVTNSTVLDIVKAHSGRPFILPVLMPELLPKDQIPAPKPFSPGSRPLEVLFVCSWASDEPIAEAAKAVATLGAERVKMHVSGRPRAEFKAALDSAPENFIVRGFLSDEEYLRLMGEVDCVMAITTAPATIVCGGAEGVALNKPLILGDTRELRAHFPSGAIFAKNSSEGIADAIKSAIDDLPRLRAEMTEFSGRSFAALDKSLDELAELVRSLQRRASVDIE